MNLRHSTKSKTETSKHASLLQLNDDTLLTLVQWFEALELLSWGMVCLRRFHYVALH
jgi:hypothetical protein